MRHALTLERTAPSSVTAAQRHAVARFRPANAGLAMVHLVQAVLVFLVAGDVDLPVTHHTSSDAAAPLVEVSVGVVLAVYFLAAGLSHALCASALRATYEADLRLGRNRIRWAVFSVSAPLLMLLIALYTGVTDVTALVIIATSTIVMIVCGWRQESHNPPGRRRTTMVPFWTGVAVALVPWVIVAGQMFGAAGRQEFSLSIFLSLFLLWASFGVNQWLQYHQVGPWSDYLHGERTYLALSLVAKSALAWQIVAGCLLV